MQYRYLGPAQLRDQLVTVDALGVDTRTVLADWLVRRDRLELVEPFTFVVAVDGILWPAPVAVSMSRSHKDATSWPPAR